MTFQTKRLKDRAMFMYNSDQTEKQLRVIWSRPFASCGSLNENGPTCRLQRWLSG